MGRREFSGQILKWKKLKQVSYEHEFRLLLLLAIHFFVLGVSLALPVKWGHCEEKCDFRCTNTL